MLRVVMCGEECADIRSVIIVIIINNSAPRAPVAGRWWNSKGRDNAANFVHEPGPLLNILQVHYRYFLASRGIFKHGQGC